MKSANTQAPVALITGAARRIGASIAARLHEAGYQTIIHYQSSTKEANDFAKALNNLRPGSAKAIAADLAIVESAQQLIQSSIDWAGRLDVLINNASIFLGNDFQSFNRERWNATFALNVQAPFILSMSAYPYLALQSGVIINIADIHAKKALKGYSIYCQSKAALLMQTTSLAREFAPLVRVNAVSPGAISWPEGENQLSPEVQQKIIAATPLRRHGRPEQIAEAVLALVKNDFITAAILPVDGGRHL